MKVNIKKRRQATHWENIFAKDTLDKGLLSKIYKELLKLNNKKMNNSSKTRAKNLNTHLTKEGMQMANKYTKRCFTLHIIQFSSVQSLSCVWLFVTLWIAAHQASLSITNSRSSLRLTSIESVMPSSHLILCRPLLLLPPIPPSIRKTQIKTMRYLYMAIRMAKIWNIYYTKCCQGCRATGTVLHCWSEGKMVQSLWKAMQKFLKS